VASGAQALMQSLAVEKPSNSRAHPLSTTYQTFNPHHTSPANNPLGHPGNTRFPAHFFFAAPMSGETVSFPEMTGVGDWLPLPRFITMAQREDMA